MPSLVRKQEKLKVGNPAPPGASPSTSTKSYSATLHFSETFLPQLFWDLQELIGFVYFWRVLPDVVVGSST